VSISNFDKRVQIEQIRYIEAKHTLDYDSMELSSDHSLHRDFDDCLSQRAQSLVQHNDLQPILGRAERVSRYTYTLSLTVAAVLGALGTLYAFTGSHTINIYSLLLVLLGFNLLSILLWLAGISLNLQSLRAGVLAKLTSWLPARSHSKHEYGNQADRAWLACHYAGRTGKWQFSKITHELWLVYLLAGFAILVLQLMIRQYDFVWGTTLLSDVAFVKLTDALSAPLQALGLITPTIEQINDTQIGASQILTAAHRYSWAQFLLGALLLFGIVPRILLWCWSMLMRAYARRHFTLDYYLPYYIHLHQQLMPLASHGEIIDADTSPPAVLQAPDSHPATHKLPSETQWVSVELGNDISWPPVSISADKDLGQVVDRESLTHILNRLKNNTPAVIAVAVSAIRPPDRGVQRTIDNLMSDSAQRWLVLLLHHEHESVSSTRLQAWYQLAKACKVPADHVISMSVS